MRRGDMFVIAGLAITAWAAVCLAAKAIEQLWKWGLPWLG